MGATPRGLTAQYHILCITHLAIFTLLVSSSGGSQTLKPDAPAGSEIQNNIKSDHTQSGSNGGVGGPNTQDVRGVLVSRLAPEDVAALSETDNVPLGVHSPEKRQNFTRCGLLGPGGTIPTGSKRCPVGQCCSHRGYCGVRTAHCGYGCNPEFGLCGPPEFRRLATELGDHNSPSPSHKLFRESAESRKLLLPPPLLTNTCGNGVCEAPHLPTGETCGSCPRDCGPCQTSDTAYTCVEPRTIALTLDDGPSDSVVDHALKVLTARNVTASFFNLGRQVKEFPGVTLAMAAGGHSIHSHGYTHTSAFQLSDEDWLQEMRQVEEETADAGVCARPILYRPPFGAHSARTDVLARNIGYRVVMWSLDTQDWQNAESSPQAVISRVNALLQTSANGSFISLQHALFTTTLKLLPKVLDLIEYNRYTPVSIERCLWGPNYSRHPSWAYAHASCASPSPSWPVLSPDEPCPLSEWSDWSACSAVGCSTGYQTRTRLTLPPALAGTASCASAPPLLERRECPGAHWTPVPSCHEGCVYSQWSEWSPCSSACAGGTSTRARLSLLPQSQIAPPPSCEPAIDLKLCNMQPCFQQ